MKKILLLVLSLMLSFNSFADGHIDFSKSKFCYLQPNVQERNGIYFYPNQQVGITSSSLCVYSDAYGQYQSKGRLLKGKKEGNWFIWDRSGVKIFDTFYKNGKKEGKEVYVDLIGRTTKTTYLDGKKIDSVVINKGGKIDSEQKYEDGEVIYDTFYAYYDNGQIKSKGNTLMSVFKLDGIFTGWYKSGQKSYESNYINGELKGKQLSWYENGQLSYESDIRENSKTAKYWHKNGQLSTESLFKNGGFYNAKSWHDNGQLEYHWDFPKGYMDGDYSKLDKDGNIYSTATYKNDKCIKGDCPQ